MNECINERRWVNTRFVERDRRIGEGRLRHVILFNSLSEFIYELIFDKQNVILLSRYEIFIGN